MVLRLADSVQKARGLVPRDAFPGWHGSPQRLLLCGSVGSGPPGTISMGLRRGR